MEKKPTLFKKFLQERLNPDVIGGLSAFLCILHCWATPLLLAAQSASFAHAVHGQRTGFFDWHQLDYFFAALTLVAVYFSVRRSSNKWIVVALWIFAVLFSFAIILKHHIDAFEYIAYLSSAMLIVLHFLNRKFQKTACAV